MAGLSAGAKVCTYTSPHIGSTFVISHAPLAGSSLKNVAKLNAGSDHLTNVSGIGQAAIRGTGGFDELFVEQGSTVYVFLDNSGTSSLAQLKAAAKLVLHG